LLRMIRDVQGDADLRQTDDSPASQLPQQRQGPTYVAHVDESVARAGLASGELFEGKLRVNANSASHSYVSLPGMYWDVLVDGNQDRNRALNGDLVAIRLKDVSEWLDRKLDTSADTSTTTTNVPSPPLPGESDGAGVNPTSMPPSLDGLTTSQDRHQCISEIDNSVKDEDDGMPYFEEYQADPPDEGVESSSMPGHSPLARSVRVTNLPFSCTQEVVMHVFSSKCGVVTAVKLLKVTKSGDLNEGRCSGSAFVDFQSAQGAQAALDLDGKLKVGDMAAPGSKVSNKMRARPVRIALARGAGAGGSGGTKKVAAAVVSQIVAGGTNLRHLPSLALVCKRYSVQPVAEVVHIFRRGMHAEACGYLQGKSGDVQRGRGTGKAQFAHLHPVSKTTPMILIPISEVPERFLQHPQEFAHQLYAARIVDWPLHSKYPVGTLVTHMGNMGDTDVETAAILVDNGVRDEPFSDSVLSCLPEVHDGTQWHVDSDEVQRRRDLRDECIFTIDPPTARDLDDALHIKYNTESDTFEVGVHIADVSFFIDPESPLDLEARERATSVYLVQRVVPMLPRLLCEQLCSLNPGVDRYAFSVIWTMKSDGSVVDTWFGRSVIRSRKQMAYGDAQQILDDAESKGVTWKQVSVSNSDDEIEQKVLMLWSVASQLRKRRYANGALSIHTVKLGFVLNDEGDPVGVAPYETNTANWLIEEFMLMANMAVAAKLYQTYPDMAFLRRHQPPNQRQLDEFIDLCTKRGLDIKGTSSYELQQSIQALVCDNEDVGRAIQSLATRPMMTAEYVCSGNPALVTSTDSEASSGREDALRHFALAVPLYTHFTSPIRRYPDVIVHRMLFDAIQNDTAYFSPKSPMLLAEPLCTNCAMHCNERKGAAKKAQEASMKLFLCNLLKSAGSDGLVTRALIMDVSHGGLLLLLPEFGIEKKVTVSADHIKYDTSGSDVVMQCFDRECTLISSFQPLQHVDARLAIQVGAIPADYRVDVVM